MEIYGSKCKVYTVCSSVYSIIDAYYCEKRNKVLCKAVAVGDFFNNNHPPPSPLRVFLCLVYLVPIDSFQLLRSK